MICIHQIKIPIFEMFPEGKKAVDPDTGRLRPEAREKEVRFVKEAAAAALKVRPKDIRKLRIQRRSVDAREKERLLFVYSVQVRLHDSIVGPKSRTELAFVEKLKNRNITVETRKPFDLEELKSRFSTDKAHESAAYDSVSAKAPSGVPESSSQASNMPDPGGQASNVPESVSQASNGTGAFRPVVAGTGPCGLFAALVLAECGQKPIVLERGGPVEERTKVTGRFFAGGRLDPDCNIQFGEGGAGTYSDGKLNTSIKDPDGTIDFVLRQFVRFGAEEEILTDPKPHLGTDVLCGIVRNIRNRILELGGEVHFHARLDGLCFAKEKEGTTPAGAASFTAVSDPAAAVDSCGSKEKKPNTENTGHGEDRTDDMDRTVTGVLWTDLKSGERHALPADAVVLATGHSARDTYAVLKELGLSLRPKDFAVGVRIQHPQELIDRALYGVNRLSDKQALLGPSPYRLTHRAANGRNVYSFCMCPGGYVVNSSSEEGRLTVNGMSYHARDSKTANAALIVNVTPEDFEDPSDPLSGIALQQKLEEAAYRAADGLIPCETYGEFRDGVKAPNGFSEGIGELPLEPRFLGMAASADVRSILPEYVSGALIDSMPAFGKIIPGYDAPGALIAGVEARTSSPVRIERNQNREALHVRGLYPAGEGAGYAGGITSAAVDGVRTALAVLGCNHAR